ncbi:MAG TPA: tetratricopeptide repeat protein [Bacteroidia bacterium]|jgi:hypothetical protein|nr:tetratricopeptide repeat protein [Bacteroidia bacterium]
MRLLIYLLLSSFIWDARAQITDTSGINRIHYKIETETAFIKNNPDSTSHYINRGNLLCQSAKYEEAITDFSTAIKLDSNCVIAYKNRGLAKMALNKYQVALQDFNKAIKLDPNDVQAYIYKSIATQNLIRAAGPSGSTSISKNIDSLNKIVKNLFKWDFSLMSRGLLLFNYERRLSKNFSLEIGAGAAYSDFIFSFYYDNGGVSKNVKLDPPSYGWGISTYSLIHNPFSNSTKKLGFAAEVNQRTYLKKNCFEGLYISTYASFREYNYNIKDVNVIRGSRGFDPYYDPNSLDPNPFKSYNCNTLFIDAGEKIGYQKHFKKKHSLFYDVYAGIAFREAFVNTLLVTDITNYGYYNAPEILTYSKYQQKLSLLNIMLGAKIGFAF